MHTGVTSACHDGIFRALAHVIAHALRHMLQQHCNCHMFWYTSCSLTAERAIQFSYMTQWQVTPGEVVGWGP